MTRLKKYISVSVLVIIVLPQAYCQNLFDLEHSKKYAEFLYQSKQYDLAAMEYERLNFMDPGNMSFRESLILSFRKSNQYDRGINVLESWYQDSFPQAGLFREYIKLSLLNGNYHNAEKSLKENPVLPAGEINYYQLSSILMQKKWVEAFEFINTRQQSPSYPGFSELCDLAREQKEINYRKPGLALALSAVVPGLGKVYSYDWKDGIISFLFVGTNAFQAYRGFSKDGVKSAYGWIFGTLGLGFYAGNLYGSWKAARDYNLRSEDYLYHDIQNSVYNSF